MARGPGRLQAKRRWWSSSVWRCIVALTYTATVVVGLAAQQTGHPALIRSPKRVLAHTW